MLSQEPWIERGFRPRPCPQRAAGSCSGRSLRQPELTRTLHGQLCHNTDRLLAPRLPLPDVTPRIGAMHGWPQGESGWPAWRGRVSGPRSGNRTRSPSSCVTWKSAAATVPREGRPRLRSRAHLRPRLRGTINPSASTAVATAAPGLQPKSRRAQTCHGEQQGQDVAPPQRASFKSVGEEEGIEKS